MIAVPKGWSSEVGADGRAVAAPPEAQILKGPDERLVAIPKGWTHQTGGDNRIVAIPPNSTFTEGPDGHIVPLPPDDYRLEDYEMYYFILRVQSITKQEEDLSGDD